MDVLKNILGKECDRCGDLSPHIHTNKKTGTVLCHTCYELLMGIKEFEQKGDVRWML